MWITSQSTATTKKSILKENGEGQEKMPLHEAAKQICLKGVTTAHQPRDAAEKPQQGQKHTVRINTGLEKNWGKLLHIFGSLLGSGDTPNLFTVFHNTRTHANK